jgi:hypothetical protein
LEKRAEELMHKCKLLLVSLLAIGLAFAILGCEGEEGPRGEKGPQGPTGPDGVDPTAQPPADRYVSIGVENFTRNEVFQTITGASVAEHVYVSFDSTLEGAPDTIVFNRVDSPPLVDGFDGEENEYGEQSSKVRLNFFNPTGDTTIWDPNILEVVCRGAYDDDYVYMAFSWSEVSIAIKDSAGQDQFVVLASESDEFNELRYNRRPDTVYNAEAEKWDTTFQYVRIDTLIEDIDTTCYPPPLDTCFIDTAFSIDTSYVWRPVGKAEDRLVLIWSEEDQIGWADAAVDLMFRKDEFEPALPPELVMDIWAWGASTSDPVDIADDWQLTGMGLVPDFGAAPYVSNYAFPDSTPIYMNRLDPNLRTQSNPAQQIYPLWYYDIVSFKQQGWATNRTVFLPGIVTMLPSQSRADIYAKSSFDNGDWVLELRRARRTSHGDDMSF